MISPGPLRKPLSHKGFTIIEMIAVFLLISLAVGIVYPVGWRIAERFERRLERAAQQKQQKQSEFMAFIRDENRPQAPR